jgi:hypothetical protein
MQANFMKMRSIAIELLNARRVAALMLLALLLAGCDACGDFNLLRGESQACRQLPPQQPAR